MRKVRGEKISMIFQDPMTALNPLMTIGSQIMEMVRLHKKITLKQAEQEAIHMLEMVGITQERFYEYPHQFSGGMRQRVLIATALACNPELLLADEPTTALDVTIQAQILEMINELKAQLGTSIILITHDLGVVCETCDEVAVIYAGKILERASKWELFKHPAHPYTIGLFNSLPDISKDLNRLSPIQGFPPDPSNLPEGCAFFPRCKYGTDICTSGDVPMVEIASGHFCRCYHPQ